jgi:hypothetical protein
MRVCTFAAGMFPPFNLSMRHVFHRAMLKKKLFRRILAGKKGKRQWEE